MGYKILPPLWLVRGLTYLSWIFVWYAISMVLVNAHEQAHYEFGTENGGLNCSVHLNFLTVSGYTLCYWDDWNSTEYHQAQLLNGMNEVITYNLEIIMSFILVIAMYFIDDNVTTKYKKKQEEWRKNMGFKDLSDYQKEEIIRLCNGRTELTPFIIFDLIESETLYKMRLERIEEKLRLKKE